MTASKQQLSSRKSPSWRLGFWVIIAIVVAFILVTLFYSMLGRIAAGRGNYWNPLSVRLTSDQQFDVVRSAVATVGLLGAGGAACIAYRRQRYAELAHELNDSAEARAQVVDLRARYTTAAEQLGHEKAAVRLAGVYAMAELADDWANSSVTAQVQTCIDVLCAYLRMPSSAEDDEQEVRASIVSSIRTHTQEDSKPSWSCFGFDFLGAQLMNANFVGSQFLGQANFTDVHFGGKKTDFSRARFAENTAFFWGTKFVSNFTVFDHALFADKIAQFESAEFSGEHVSFNNANFTGEQNNFSGVTFGAESTSFCSVNFGHATTSFWRAQFFGIPSFDAAIFSSFLTHFALAEFRGTYTSFVEAVFPAFVDFDNALFEGTINFQGAAFESTASFKSARLVNTVKFNEIDLPAEVLPTGVVQ